MHDLRPYTCTAEDCSQSDKTYSNIKDYRRHEILAHEAPYAVTPIDDFAKRAGKRITCLFCGQQIIEGKGQHSRGRHVGQHMEEIAFTVVPKAYEDWEFYSQASSRKQVDQHTSPSTREEQGCEQLRCLPCPKDVLLSGSPADLRPYACIPCDRHFARPKDLSRHHQNFHFSCPKCSQHFPSPFQLNRHQLNHRVHRCDEINPYTGKLCNVEFSRPYDLTRHKYVVHSPRKKSVRCKHCMEEKVFSGNNGLARHMRVVHPEVDTPQIEMSGQSPLRYTHCPPSPAYSDASSSDRDLTNMPPPPSRLRSSQAFYANGRAPQDEELTPESYSSDSSSTASSGGALIAEFFKYDYAGCTAAPFQTQYLLK